MSIHRAYKLLKEIGFTRCGGSDEELKAANIILSKIKEAGHDGIIEEFEVNYHDIKEVYLKDEQGRSYEVTAYGYSGNVDELTAPFYYMETYGDVDKYKAKGCIVLVNTHLTYDAYEAIVNSGALGFITFNGDVLDTKQNSDIDLRELRKQVQESANGVKLPGVHMRAKEAMRLVRNAPKSLTMHIKQDEFHQMSRNVICEIEGTTKKDEVIVYTAHYDSVAFSKGVYDNGAGSVIIYEIFRYFLENRPERTLRFIWCGSEERGLLGSKAYVATHEEDLKNIVLNINVDVGGSVLGRESAIVTADESLKHYVDYLAKMNGKSLLVHQDIYSSDCIPFVDKGVPAINFCRFGAPGGAHIHDRHDTLYFMSKEALQSTLDVAMLFSKEVVNSVVFPVPKKIPQVIVDKTNKYLRKKV